MNTLKTVILSNHTRVSLVTTFVQGRGRDNTNKVAVIMNDISLASQTLPAPMILGWTAQYHRSWKGLASKTRMILPLNEINY